MSTTTAVRALIAEDEPLLAAHLRSELQRLWPGLDIVATVANGRQALAQTLSLRPDICFLDIRMPGMTGLEAAQALVEDWPDEEAATFPLIVFVTAYDQYAVQAFERQASDYLLKPVEPRRLQACLQRLQTRLGSRPRAPATSPAQAPPASADGSGELAAAVEQLRQLVGQFGARSGATTPGGMAVPSDGMSEGMSDGGHDGTPTGLPGAQAGDAAAQERLTVIQAQVGATIHLVPVEDVLYFEAADKYLRVITAEREHLIRSSFRELLPRLDGQRFWQVHRSLVVQIRMVNMAERDEGGKIHLRLRGRTERLPVSRLYAHLFKGM